MKWNMMALTERMLDNTRTAIGKKWQLNLYLPPEPI
jgi:hypothetical protein